MYRTGLGLITKFIKHSYNTWLHFIVHCNTHTLIFLVLVCFHRLSPHNVVASSALVFWTENLHSSQLQLQIFSAGQCPGPPTDPLQSLNSRLLTLQLTWLTNSSWPQGPSYITWNRTPKKTLPLLGQPRSRPQRKLFHCCVSLGTDRRGNTAFPLKNILPLQKQEVKRKC
jgi:hypothetical protein